MYAYFFSSLDFSSGYWQIPLHPSIRKHVFFVHDGRTYFFIRLPFGLNVSNTAFGQGLDAVFESLAFPFCCQKEDVYVYVDDVLYTTSSFEYIFFVIY